MTSEQAIERIADYIRVNYPSYHPDSLTASRFSVGWTVYNDMRELPGKQVFAGQTIFLIGDNGEIMESSSSLMPGIPEEEFEQRFA